MDFPRVTIEIGSGNSMTRWLKLALLLAILSLETGCRNECGERRGLFRGGLFGNRNKNQTTGMPIMMGSPSVSGGSSCCGGDGLIGTPTSGPILGQPGNILPSPMNAIPPAGIQEKQANPKEYDPKMSNSTGLSKTITEAKSVRPY
jgi:hypothetical protein